MSKKTAMPTPVWRTFLGRRGYRLFYGADKSTLPSLPNRTRDAAEVLCCSPVRVVVRSHMLLETRTNPLPQRFFCSPSSARFRIGGISERVARGQASATDFFSCRQFF